MKQTIVVLLFTMLCACGATPPLGDKTSNKSTDNKWVGRTVDELVIANGEPSNIYTLDGGGRAFEYLQFNKITTSTQPSLSTEDERARRIRAKRKNLASDPSQDCNILKILFNVSASDIIESWSTKGGECK